MLGKSEKVVLGIFFPDHYNLLSPKIALIGMNPLSCTHVATDVNVIAVVVYCILALLLLIPTKKKKESLGLLSLLANE